MKYAFPIRLTVIIGALVILALLLIGLAAAHMAHPGLGHTLSLLASGSDVSIHNH